MFSMIKTDFSFIEAPIYQGQKNFGVSLGPSFIRQCLIDQGFESDNFVSLTRQSSKTVNFNAYEQLSYTVEREIRRGCFPFIAGGDHSLSLGSVQGLLRYEPDLKVIWIDAHGDINTRKTSLTGSYHGMPAAFLLGEDSIEGQHWFTENLKPENLIYFGVRDLDTAEKLYLDKKNISHYTASDIKNGNLNQIIAQITSQVRNSKVHFSVDSDAFDPLLAPSTGVPVADGLDYESVRELIHYTNAVSDIISYEYVELNPQIFQNPQDVLKTAQIGIDLLREILISKKKKEFYHGSHDRQCYSAGTNLLHAAF